MAQTEEQISNFRAYVIGGMSKGSMGGSSPAKRRQSLKSFRKSSPQADDPF